MTHNPSQRDNTPQPDETQQPGGTIQSKSENPQKVENRPDDQGRPDGQGRPDSQERHDSRERPDGQERHDSQEGHDSRGRPDGPRDTADRLVALAVRLLPADRRDWGRAMRAELAAVDGARARLQHALGCLRVAATRPATLRRFVRPVLTAGVLIVLLTGTSGIGYEPLRWGLVVAVSVLLGVAWLGRRPGPLGPVGDGWAQQLFRGGAGLLVAAMTTAFALSAAAHGSPAEQASGGVPIFTVLLASYLTGFLAVTARPAALPGRALTAAAVSGVAGALLWLAMVLSAPPIPSDVDAALIATALAMAAAAVAGNRAGPAAARLAALCAGTLSSLLVFAEVALLADHGPARLIPRLVPMALSPADNLANSRIELDDPYVAMLFLASALAIGLTIVSFTTRRPRHGGITPETHTPTT